VSIGRSQPRRDAGAKVTGAARFPADGWPADALHAKVVFSNQVHARMVGFDASAAEAVPGVVAVLSAADVPVNEYGLTMFDQPVLVGPGSTGRSSVVADVSRWEADHVAVVVAEDADAAAAGAAALAIEWEPLPIVADLDAGLADDVLVHPEQGSGSNVYTSYRIRKGDVESGWAAAEVVVEGTYEVPYQEHAYLQPEAALSYVDDEGRVTVEVAGQWAHEDQAQIAHALDLPLDAVRVVYPSIGGAFGGREDISLQIVMALAAMRLAERGERRPIATRWSREESIVGHHKRHRGRVHARLGATRHGKITVVEADAWLDAGAYNYTSNKVLGNLHLGLAGPYEVPNARIDSHAVYTNATPGGAFRGFGAPQATYVAETQINRLAAELGMDPVEVRRRNLLREGSIGITQTPMPAGVTLPQVVDECAAAAEAGRPDHGADADAGAGADVASVRPFATLGAEPSAVRRGRGFACAFKNVGFSFGFPERCEAEIVLHGGDGVERVDLHHAGAEVGQGAHQAFLQMAAEAVGVDVELVEGHFGDTATSGDSGSASASRLTWMAGNAILGAAEEAEKAWREGDRPARGRFRFVPPPTEALDPETGVCVPNFAYGYVAQAVEVSVDVETGHVVVDRVVNASDVGRAINPALVVGQIEGGVVQAHGYVLTEDLRSEGGRLVNPRLSTYLIPGVRDVPRSVESVVLELADPLGPFGVRGMAEMPMIPYAAAVVAAVHDATGVWFTSFPLTPSVVLAGLAEG
jgi:CO/xanthine dehydrogenase Mo-binding subunit